MLYTNQSNKHSFDDSIKCPNSAILHQRKYMVGNFQTHFTIEGKIYYLYNVVPS